MSDRQDYLNFLAERGYREEEVARIVPLSPEELGLHLAGNNPGFLSALLQFIFQAREGDEESKLALKWLTDSFTENNNHLIQGMFTRLCNSLRQCGVSIPEGLFAAVYPTGSFNGATLKRDEGALILIESGCFNVIEAAIDYFFGPWIEEEKPEKLAGVIDDYCILRKLPDPFQRMTPTIEYVNPGIRMLALSELVSRTEEFVLAHELGHIVLGHSGYAVPREDTGTNTVIIENSNSHDQEYEADRWAMQSLIKLGKEKGQHRNYLALVCSGPIIFLGIQLLVEEKRKTLGKEATSHPPAIERLQHMKMHMVEDILMGDPSFEGMWNSIRGIYRDDTLGNYSHIGDRFLELVVLTHEYMFRKPLNYPFPLNAHSAIYGAQRDEKTCAVFSYNGLGMIGDKGGQVSILQLGKQPEIQRRLHSDSGSISSLAISDKFFAFGTTKCEIVVVMGKEVLVRGKMDSPVTALCASNSGDSLLSGSDNGFVHVYIMESAIPLLSQRKRFFRERPLLIPVEGSNIHDCILSLAINNDDTLLAAGGFFDNKITIWDIGKSVLLNTILIPRVRGVAGARALAWYDNYLLSGGIDGIVRCWNPGNGDLKFEIDVGSLVTSIAISPDRKWIAAGTEASQVAVWPFISPDRIIKKQVGGEICGLGFPVDYHTLVTCNKSGKLEYIPLEKAFD